MRRVLLALLVLVVGARAYDVNNPAIINGTRAPTWLQMECPDTWLRWQCRKRAYECVWKKIPDHKYNGMCLFRHGTQRPTTAPVRPCKEIKRPVPCDANPGSCKWVTNACVKVPATKSPTKTPSLPPTTADCYHTYGKLNCCGYAYYKGLSIFCKNPMGLTCKWSKAQGICYDG